MTEAFVKREGRDMGKVAQGLRLVGEMGEGTAEHAVLDAVGSPA